MKYFRLGGYDVYNATPHTVNISTALGVVEIEPYRPDKPIRLDNVATLKQVEGVTVLRIRGVKVVNAPHIKEGRLFIVSQPVFAASDRADFVSIYKYDPANGYCLGLNVKKEVVL